MARYLSYSILKSRLNPSSYSLKIKFENGIKSSSSKTYNRIFSEKLLIQTTKELFKKLDAYPHIKVYYISINVSNFIGKANFKVCSLVDFYEDKKMQELSFCMCKLRDKYGIDTIKNANEII